MLGQWIGKTKEEKARTIIWNVDVKKTFDGRAWFLDTEMDKNISFGMSATLKQEGESIQAILSSDVYLFDPRYQFSGETPLTRCKFPYKMHLEVTGKDNVFGGKCFFNGNEEVEFTLHRSNMKSSSVFSKQMSWNDFKKLEWVKDDMQAENVSDLIFRGQDDSGKVLSTSFHREGRNDLFRYREENVRWLIYYINPVSPYQYDLNSSEDIGSVLSLAQHYGFPTPFLDWTESPYVAAYFAYESFQSEQENHSGNVSVFAFNRKVWKEYRKEGDLRSRRLPIFELVDPRPTFTVRNPAIRIGNERALPQQSIVTFTNIVDIEKFIKTNEEEDNKRYLMRIDLPVKGEERGNALKELRLMGIHAGSLFPGMEGICKSLKEKYFSD